MLPCSAESAESHSDTHSGDGLQYGCQMVRHGSADAKPSCVQSDTWVIVWVRKDMCCLCLNFLQTTKKKNLIPCANNSVSTPIYIWAENKWLFLRHFLLLSVQPTVNMFVLWNSLTQDDHSAPDVDLLLFLLYRYCVTPSLSLQPRRRCGHCKITWLN